VLWFVVVVNIAADSRHIPMCMSVAAVPKDCPSYFSRTESSSLLQMSSLPDVFSIKPIDAPPQAYHLFSLTLFHLLRLRRS